MHSSIKKIALCLFSFSTFLFCYTIIHTNIKEQKKKKIDINDFKVIVYYPCWEDEQFSKIQFDIVTHVMYAFAIPTEEGSLLPLSNETLAKNLIKKTHENNKQIFLSVGGWGYDDVILAEIFYKATDSYEKIERLSDDIVEMCLNYGFDGVDLDWEYPNITDESMERYESLTKLLSSKLKKENKSLSAAIISGVSSDGKIYPAAQAYTDEALSHFDFINIMVYDGGKDGNHSPYALALLSSEYWLNHRKIDKHKIMLGVPFYSDQLVPYKDIIKENPEACTLDSIIYKNQLSHYNGIPTIKNKTDYAVNHLGGIMVWEITNDTSDQEKSLLTAIGTVINSYKKNQNPHNDSSHTP